MIGLDMMSPFVEDFYERNAIDPSYFKRYDVKRGLRNADGTGVVVGLTDISNVHGYVVNEGDKQSVEGRLTFRGYSLEDLVEYAVSSGHYGFEGASCLLLMGAIPTDEQRAQFQSAIDAARELPPGFVASFIMTGASPNVMNALQRSVQTLYSYDDAAEDRSPEHEMAVAVSLLSELPRIMVLSYHAARAAHFGESMIMHRYLPGQSTAETILSMLRPTREFTPEEARMLDVMLMIHAEHGGGNNSTFTCRCVTSSDTDPYSAYSAAIGSLKGSRHGGANINVTSMVTDIEQHVSDWSDEGQVSDYLRKIVNKEAYDHTGLIYGMGHAVYTLSDPRAVICKQYARDLAKGTQFEEEFALLETIESLAPSIIAEKKGQAKAICANIDMYSGFVYRMLGIPSDLITPLFACSRMAGWAAHRFEEIVSGRRIMRPAYKSITDEQQI